MNNADEIVEQAESYLKKKGWFSSPKYGEAIDLYLKAGNLYKLKQNWTASFDCFIKAAEINKKTGDFFEAASKYKMAANSIKNIEPEKAVFYTEKASDMFFEIGRLGLAAKNIKDIGEIYEKLVKDNKKAAFYYEKAAEIYNADESPAMSTGVLLSAAFLHTKNDEYEKAAKGFEKAAFYYLETAPVTSIAPKYFFNACLCYLCFSDVVENKKILQKYSKEAESFSKSKEKEFLEKMMDAVEEEDFDLFKETIEKNGKMLYLDEWKEKILSKIKDRIECTSLM